MFLLPPSYFSIRQTKAKGRGVFARKRISAGTVIGDYLGVVVHIAQYDASYEKGMYLMAFTDESFIYPPVDTPGIHCINHACKPNCWMYVYQGHTLFFALRDIQPGEELTISYLLSPKEDSCGDSCVHVCKCGGSSCTGSMHISQQSYRRWRKFLHREMSRTTLAPYRIGAPLQKLLTYPSAIPINPIYASIS